MKGNARTVERFKIITNKEMQILITVMHKYNIQLVSAEKIRGAYKITTAIGNFCLKKTKHGRNKAKSGCILTEELILNGFPNIAKYFRTKEGAFYVSYKSNIFYLTEWLEGYECDLTNIDEAVNCTKLLSEFHNISNRIEHNKIHLGKNLKDWPKLFSSNLNNLEKFKKIIIGKRIKNDFDVLFLEGIDNFYDRGVSAIDILKKSQYYKLSKVANDKKTICHNSFYYKNIIKKEGEYFITDLDGIMIDLQISDLGRLIRRLMFKQSCGWDFNFAKALIEAYNSINRLCKEDLEIMFALIIFPQKFWKLGQRRYIDQKKWSETKYFHKLNRILSYNENQEKFFADYLIFLQEYL
ncbi:MAG: CotS family spore coat protein [Clostridium sp.]|uniref:CotS family spore coat protein n=1 Tax=Clostridium sp. TaxID=1506 RepID=UPI003D6D91B5